MKSSAGTRMIVTAAAVLGATITVAEVVPAASRFAAEPAFADSFAPGWESTQTDWRVATWKQNGARMHPDRCRTDGQGLLIQTVLAGEPYRGGSLQTDREFGFGRWVARVKPSNVPGVLNSIFIKDWDDLTTETPNDGLKGEVDIEFLTSTFGEDHGEVHIAIHLLDRPRYLEADVPVPFNPSDDFRDWGFDILPDRVVWHVDGEHLYTWVYTEDAYIDPGYEFFFNSWTRDVWILGPPEADAHYAIDWVAFYPLKDAPPIAKPAGVSGLPDMPELPAP